MCMKRVVITGMGAVSPFGRGVDTLVEALFAGRNGVTRVPALAEIVGMRTRVAALVPGIDPMEIPRKFRRSMSSMSVFATLAARDAAAQGGLDERHFAGGRLGVSIGSTVGSPQATQEFFDDFRIDNSLERLFALLRIKSISADPAFAADCKAAANHLAKDIASLGFQCVVPPPEQKGAAMAHSGTCVLERVNKLFFLTERYRPSLGWFNSGRSVQVPTGHSIVFANNR